MNLECDLPHRAGPHIHYTLRGFFCYHYYYYYLFIIFYICLYKTDNIYFFILFDCLSFLFYRSCIIPAGIRAIEKGHVCESC